ncbi:MAG: GcvT family protein [Deltaproteobacteria bacterium]|jgi:4-methylaminobutanoate oxidase (formaldehyde-forming)|nr:GcvT family protein [Deltaproteobacteria bacterium]
MRDSAQVVIIGGGIIGCSTAYHLTKMGWKDVVLVEKGELTSGSTWHAAGLVGQLRSERNLTRMLQYSVSLYEQLEKETGLNTGWKRCGCLHLAGTKERMYELKMGVTIARSFGLEMNIITPNEAYDLCPIISLDDVIGAAFIPSDGQADPAGITQAMAKGARNRGANIYRNTLVTGFEFNGKRLTAVKTDKGDIQCEIVVNCTGMWGYQVGRMLGVNIPLVPFQHQFLVTDSIKGLPPDMPTMRDKDNLLYYKKEVDGIVMGGYEPNGIPWAVDGVPNDFTSQLLEPDFDHFQSLSDPAMKRTPCLKTAGIVKLFNGPEAFTPDGNAIMGPAPELDNCFVAVGFNAFGIAAGGGAGRMMAEWIIEGEPSLDIWPLDIRRFGPHHRNRSFNVERTREIYGKHYTIHWPYEEHDSARGIRRSPLYSLLKEKGAVYGSKYGWERANWFAPEGIEPKDELTFEVPNWFEHVGNEHRAARESVILIDQSSFCKFEIEGPEAFEFLNRLAANNIDKPVGSITYTQLCNARGTIESDITVTRLAEDKFFLVTGTALGLHDAEWIKKHMPKDGSVVFKDVTSALAVINVIGPNSRKLLEKVTCDDIGNEEFMFGKCKTLSVGCASVTALRVTYVGELGYELYIPIEFACHVYETLWEAGQDLDIVNAGYRAINSLHFEKGYGLWGAELTPEYTLFDAGLGFYVDLNKDDFLGREALINIKEKRPVWKLCTFTIDTDQPIMIRGSEPIMHNGKVIGITTSGGYGYTVGKTIVYSYIPLEDAKYTQDYEIEVYMEVYSITRHENRALYDPERKKILM